MRCTPSAHCTLHDAMTARKQQASLLRNTHLADSHALLNLQEKEETHYYSEQRQQQGGAKGVMIVGKEYNRSMSMSLPPTGILLEKESKQIISKYQLRNEIAVNDREIERLQSGFSPTKKKRKYLNTDARISRIVERYENYKNSDDILGYLLAIGHNIAGNF
ncbi:hypothetical protein ANN_18505 [Periplaneta americana]|uniref:Uncharacterized protein n=1 Tax=Periplaneta americana TaxID=6978 RepID=A0ABQ8SR14_PERAM|nr:hypothetical protein ANN_18505 [Periplaneta americana]